LVCGDAVTGDAESVDDLVDEVIVECAVADDRWRREGQVGCLVMHGDQASGSAAEGGVFGERHLTFGG
jgi:hypothetical protein